MAQGCLCIHNSIASVPGILIHCFTYTCIPVPVPVVMEAGSSLADQANGREATSVQVDGNDSGMERVEEDILESTHIEMTERLPLNAKYSQVAYDLNDNSGSGCFEKGEK